MSKHQQKWCRFRLRDVICPEPREALERITPDLEVAGQIVFLSDQGEETNRFAIMEVQGIHSPLIVPVECLRVVPGEPRAAETGEQVSCPESALEGVVRPH